jgi:hypothetical protein
MLREGLAPRAEMRRTEIGDREKVGRGSPVVGCSERFRGGRPVCLSRRAAGFQR